MSGGHFEYNDRLLPYMANTIREDIALALKPKPEKIHEDYWVIYVHTSLNSYFGYRQGLPFRTYQEAEDELLWNGKNERATRTYPIRLDSEEDVVFQSKDSYMSNTPDGEKIPVLYTIHHCIFDHYPYDEDILELGDETIELLKETYRKLKIAAIYAHEVDYMLSGDSGEDDLKESIKRELEEFEEEYRNIDWTRTAYVDE